MDAFKTKLVDIADSNMRLLDGTAGPLRRIFEESELLIGVWNGPQEKDGVGMLVLKGDKLLREIIANRKNLLLRISAVRCHSYAQAVAIKQLLNERPLSLFERASTPRKRRHRHPVSKLVGLLKRGQAKS